MTILLVGAILELTSFAIGQASIECNSTRKADEWLIVCTGNGYKSVLQCDANGCNSKTGEDVDYTAEALQESARLRDLCLTELKFGSKSYSFCKDLADREDYYGEVYESDTQVEKIFGDVCDLEKQSKKKNLFLDGCLQFAWARKNKKKEEESQRLTAEVLSKYHDREDELRLELCAKGVLEKPYCDELHKRLDAKKQ